MRLSDRVHIQRRVSTQTALGETITWTPVETRYARVIPLDAATKAAYMQMKSEVTHKVVFNEGVSLSLGDNRLLWEDKILKPVEPVQEIRNKAVVMVKECQE